MAGHKALHGPEHTDGTDDIQNSSAGQKGLMTPTQWSKLDGMASGADVTGDNPPQAHVHSHASTTGQTENDHHAKSHAHDGVDGSGTVDYDDITGIPLLSEFAKIMWTSDNGSDLTGDGSYLLPFLTVQKCYDIALTGTEFVVIHLASATQILTPSDATKICNIHGFGNCGKVNIIIPASKITTLKVDGILIDNVTINNTSGLTLKMYSRCRLSFVPGGLVQVGTGQLVSYFYNNISDYGTVSVIKSFPVNYIFGSFIDNGTPNRTIFTNGIDLVNAGRLENVLDPVASDDGATKGYVVNNFAPLSHNHAGADINSGTLDGDRLPAFSETKKAGVPATGTPSGKYLKDDGTWATPSGLDSTAIHKATASEISAMTEKTVPIKADLLVIEDSANSNNKKKIQIGNIQQCDTLYMSMGTTAAYARNQTGYMCYYGFYVTETSARIVVGKGVISKMWIRISSNTITDPTTVTLMKNGVATTMVITITAATTGLFSTTANPVTVADGDELSWEVAIGTGSGIQSISFKAGAICKEVSA